MGIRSDAHFSAFPQALSPGGRESLFHRIPPTAQWAEQIAIKKRGGIHFRLFSLLSPQVCERKRVRAADCNPLAETGWHLWCQPVSRTYLLI